MSYAVTSVQGAPPVYRPRPAGSSHEEGPDSSAQIAAMQTVLMSLQRQKSEAAASDIAEAAANKNHDPSVESDRDDTVQQIDDQISDIQSQIAMLRQQASMQTAKKALEAQDTDDDDTDIQPDADATAATRSMSSTEPPQKTPREIELESEERQQLAITKAAEQGLTIGTNVDTYA